MRDQVTPDKFNLGHEIEAGVCRLEPNAPARADPED
jgi:hypothetical protein